MSPTMRVSLTPVEIALAAAHHRRAAALSACDAVSEAMGIGKLPPDEYAVAPPPARHAARSRTARAAAGRPAAADIDARSVAAQAWRPPARTPAETPPAAPRPTGRARDDHHPADGSVSGGRRILTRGRAYSRSRPLSSSRPPRPELVFGASSASPTACRWSSSPTTAPPSSPSGVVPHRQHRRSARRRRHRAFLRGT